MSIQLNDVCFAYSETPKKNVLNISNWTVSSAEQVFVHGPSGCGKSTLLNLLSGMLRATSGSISVLGTRLDSMNSRQLDRYRADHIGYIFQQFNLVSYLDAVDNIQLAHRFSRTPSQSKLRDEITSLLTTFHIDPSDWHKPVARLSIGQQQRIAIARAMINKPELLIADEPTSSLDQKNRDTFMSELMNMVSEHKTTLVFVSHDMSLASYFDRVDALSTINQVTC